MASGLEPAPTAWDFKGHPQPPINDRLDAARNFLSDEDPERCLAFDQKFAEIEEFIADIQRQGLSYDKDLFGNVNVKLQEHRAWEKFHAGWTDTQCFERPLKHPWSTRLIDAKTTALITEGHQLLGIETHTRSDAAPFTTEREDDHDEFMDAMKLAATENPDTTNTDDNLLYKEHRAYDWAIQDPAFIPLWMHPTKGIPKKGITDVDENLWYRKPPPPLSSVRLLPDRGYIPDYLLITEARINDLLKILNTLNAAQFKELDDVLREYYPDELQVLYDQYHAFVDSQDINVKSTGLIRRALTPAEIAQKDLLKVAFDTAHENWLKSFSASGVYMMVRKPLGPNSIEVQLPGVFYVDDGVLDPKRSGTLDAARNMLNLATGNGYWEILEDTQQKIMAILVRDYQSQDVRELEEERDGILKMHGVARPLDLIATLYSKYTHLDDAAINARKAWFLQATSGLDFEFHYLRPGEMREANPNIMYLPWSMKEMPDGLTPDPPMGLPSDVLQLQIDINNRLSILQQSNAFNGELGDQGDQELNNLLVQVAYPKLRRLLIPWMAIKAMKDASQPTTPLDDTTWTAVDAVVPKLWSDWANALIPSVQVKVPSSQMLPETPDILYYHPPDTLTGDPQAIMQNSQQAINAALHQTPTPPTQAQNESDQEFTARLIATYNPLDVLFRDYQYPALLKAGDDVNEIRQGTHPNFPRATVSQNARDNAAQQQSTTFKDMRLRWMKSKLGHTISIRRPIPNIDPDDDPNIVYYRGAVTDPRATKTVRDCMDLTKPAAQAVAGLAGFLDSDSGQELVPPYIRYLERLIRDNPGDALNKTILNWHLEYLVSGPLAPLNARGYMDDLGVWRCTYINGKKEFLNRGRNPDSGLTTTYRSNESGNNTPRLRILGGSTNGDRQVGRVSTNRITRARSRTSSSNTTNWALGQGTNPPIGSNGYFARPPLSPRSTGMHPDLLVDLDQFRPHITSIEKEINALLVLFRAHQRSKNPENLTEANKKRLYALLEQFIPQIFYDMDDRDFAFAQSIPERGNTRKTRNRYERMKKQLIAMRRETIGMIDNWVQSMMHSHYGIYVDISDNLEDTGDGMALYLQPRHTGTGANFKLLAARDVRPTTPILSSGLIAHQVKPPKAPDVFAAERAFRTAFLPRLRDRINALLTRRATQQNNLNWEESEELLDKIQGFMSPGLFNLEEELWQLDRKLRYQPPTNGQPALMQPPTATDVETYLRLNERFQAAYESWLDTFPSPPGVHIQPSKSSTNATRPGALYIEDGSFWQHWPSGIHGANSNIELRSSRRAARSRSLPQFVTDKMRDINRYLEGPVAFRWDDEMDSLLRPIFRPIQQRFRAKSHAALHINPNEVVRPEHDVVIESLTALAYRMMKQRARNMINGSIGYRARLVEYGAGRYVQYFGRDLGSQDNLRSPYPPEFTSFCDQTADALFTRVWNHALVVQERTTFLAFTARIRNLVGISNNDLQNLITALQQAASELQSVREDALWQVFESNDPWPPRDAAQVTTLTQYQQSFFIHKFSRMYPDIVDSVVIQPTMLTINQLVRVPRPGEQPSRRVPDIAKPSEGEIRQLEVEINNLLARERTGGILPREALEFDYLLEAFLPSPLQAVKLKLDRLEANRLQLPGLNTNDEFRYHSYRQNYLQDFASFKQNISRAGLFLDKWWFTEEAIALGCSRARVWSRATLRDKSPGTYPATSNVLEDEDMKIWHDIYLDMRDYAYSFEENPNRERRLLYDAIPDELSLVRAEVNAYKQQFNTLIQARARNSTAVFTYSAWLQDVMRKFLTGWTEWLTSVPPSNLSRIRTQLRDNGRPAGTIMGSNTGTGRGALNAGNRIPIDFSSKAERRGIKRAAIELALNVLATNQEQHRPNDIYRILDLPGAYRPLDEGMPLSLPLEPWNRPVELDTFEYTKKLLDFRQVKDTEYNLARSRENDINPSEILIPANFNGPFAKNDAYDLEWAKREWLRELVGVFRALQDAYAKAPRPLLEEVLNCVGHGFTLDVTNPLHQGPPLTRDEVRLIGLMTESSWDDVRQPYPTLTPNTTGYAAAVAAQKELENFEVELNAIDWQDRTWLPANNPNPTLYEQAPYDATIDTVQGYSISVIAQHVNNGRIAAVVAAGQRTATLCSQQTMVGYFAALQRLRRIHMNLTAIEPYDTLVAKIPVTGHPENRYIVSRQAAQTSPGVSLDATTNSYVVQYDAKGKKGPPIVQPNKVEHLRSIGYRIGRDTEVALRIRATPNKTDQQFLLDRYQGLRNTEARMIGDRPKQNTLTVQDLALKLHKIAPFLARDNAISPTNTAGVISFNAKQAAMLLQMQILEELSNCWEPRFPLKERLWDFADDRLRPHTRTLYGEEMKVRRRLTRYFDVRRFPPGCQDQRTKDAILKSGPKFEDRPITPPATPPRLGNERSSGNGGGDGNGGDEGGGTGGGGGGGNNDDKPDEDDGNDGGNQGQLIPMTRERRYQFQLDDAFKVAKAKAAKDKAKAATDAKNKGIDPNTGYISTKPNNSNNPLLQQTMAQQEAAALKKQSRYLMGHMPHFPFGETPYQQAYQSFCMENDLRDVPEFQPVAPPRPGLFGRRPSPEPTDPFALPPIPPNWEPDNISFGEKRAQLIELAKKTDGFPDATILENYHTPEEIEYMTKEAAFRKHHAELAIAQDAIRKHCKKERYEQVSPLEFHDACIALDINKQTGKFNVPPAASAGGAKGAKDAKETKGKKDPKDKKGNGGNGGGESNNNNSGGDDKKEPPSGRWDKFKNYFGSKDETDDPDLDTPIDGELSDEETQRPLREAEAERDRQAKIAADEAERVRKLEEAREKRNKKKRSPSPSKRTSPRKKAKP